MQRVGINVDKDKLLIALRQDAERYREAYANGYDTGYEKRDEEIVRCIDCKYGNWWSDENVIVCDKLSKTRDKNWFCADGERKAGEV